MVNNFSQIIIVVDLNYLMILLNGNIYIVYILKIFNSIIK